MRSYKAHISTRKNSYAIRKFSIGIASILVGSALFFGYNQESHASLQVTEDSNSSTNNINADVVQSSGAITKQEGIQNTTQNESVEKVSNNVNEDASLNNNVNLQNNQLLASEQASENNNLVGSSKSNEHQASGSEVSSDTSLETQSNNNVEETKASNTLNQLISNNTQSDLTTTLNNNEASSQESNFDTKSVVSEKQKIYPAQVVRKNVNAHTKDVDVLKLIENNSKYLSEEERKLFLRMATRYSSFVSRDWNHIYNKNYNGISSNVN
ncbi:YSIRK-type signal peptide-containing protein, partial [Staphylococcus kloosii]